MPGEATARIFVQQRNRTECGPAALTMVLKYLGYKVSLDELVGRLPMASDGTSAAAILEVARSYGLRCRGGQIHANELIALPPFSILHWQNKHFVVLQRATRSRVRILDPARGVRSLSLFDAGKSFSGVALVFAADRRCRPRPK